jgi:hypothetical protein
MCVLTWQYIWPPRARLERGTYCLGDRLRHRRNLPRPRSAAVLPCPRATAVRPGSLPDQARSGHGRGRWSGGWRGIDASAKDAELIPFRISQDDPGCGALADVNWLSAQCPESGHFVIPLAADRAHVQVVNVGGGQFSPDADR